MPGKFENAYNEIGCVADALNLLYRLYKWFRRVRGPAAKQTNNENETKVVSPLMKMDKMFCAHWLQRSEATKTLKCTFEHAHIIGPAVKSAFSRILLSPADSRHIWTLWRRCLRERGSYFFNLPTMSSRKENTAEEKSKTEYFSWSDDEVELLLNVWHSTTKLRRPFRIWMS